MHRDVRAFSSGIRDRPAIWLTQTNVWPHNRLGIGSCLPPGILTPLELSLSRPLGPPPRPEALFPAFISPSGASGWDTRNSRFVTRTFVLFSTTLLTDTDDSAWTRKRLPNRTTLSRHGDLRRGWGSTLSSVARRPQRDAAIAPHVRNVLRLVPEH